MDWDIESSIIFESIFGSQVYGTSTPKSDEDYRGVCIPPKEVQNSLLINFDQKDNWKEKDRVIYNLKKFFLLCKEANPTMIEFLFIPVKWWITPRGLIRQVHPWIQIIEEKNLFISKKAKYSFSGYAHDQLNRIKTHRNWLLNPPKVEPLREAFNLSKNPRLSKDQLSAIVSLPEEIFILEYQQEARREKSYYEAKKHWDLYMNWAKNRNPERAELEERYGYDTKHAMHLVRLMYEGEEILMTGKITFPRPEKEELVAIRNGIYNYDQLMERVKNFDERFEELYEKSELPDSPDDLAINSLYLKIIDYVYQFHKIFPHFNHPLDF